MWSPFISEAQGVFTYDFYSKHSYCEARGGGGGSEIEFTASVLRKRSKTHKRLNRLLFN